MAAIASLVWSTLPTATGAEIRQILIDTATDLSLPGPDDQTGAGMVNAEAAVRRAIALARDASLANLWQRPSAADPVAPADRIPALAKPPAKPPAVAPVEVEAEVIQLVAHGIHTGSAVTACPLQSSNDFKQSVERRQTSVDPIFARETSWIESVAVAKVEPDQGQRSRQPITTKSEIDDFWQDYESVL
jgi:hypothetical protein